MNADTAYTVNLIQKGLTLLVLLALGLGVVAKVPRFVLFLI